MSYQSVFRPGLFEGRTIIVTGGGSGIGRCTAHELASLGADVLLVGRKVDKLQRVAGEIAEDGGRADFAVCDVRVEDAVREMVSTFLEKHPRIEGLVNNAGGQFPSPLSAISQKGFETVVRTNLVGGFLVARELYNQHLAEHGGSIVNIVADMHQGMPGMGHSGAARAGMVNFTMTAALEWAPSGVRVNAVAPGWIASSGLDHYDASIRTTVIPMLRTSVPLKRLGTESEISAAICFLLSDAAAFITGAMLPVDGGAPLYSAVWPTPDHDRSKPFVGFHRAITPDALKRQPEAPSIKD